MDKMRQAPHSYYPSDAWTEADDRAARARDAAWEASDPNMRALAALGPAMRDEGEFVETVWTPAA